MPKFTNEQQEAIDKEGSNILVSAGAGSGKTAVLSERVLRKVNEGVSVDNLLILTFTNAAAAEMKERIRKKIKANDNLKEEVEKLDSAYITTFDAFTLAVVKKYHYLINLPKDINICESSVLDLKKEEILDNLFEKLYEQKDEKFVNLIKTYFLKNDNELKKFIKSTYKSIELIYDKNNFLNSYIDTYFSQEYINNYINLYLNMLKNVVNDIEKIYGNITRLDSDYSKKLDLGELFFASGYDMYKNYSNFKLPNLPRGSSEELKSEKDKLKKFFNTLTDLTKYSSVDELKSSYLSIKNNTEVIINILKYYDELVTNLKYTENIFDFLDIEKMAIDILNENDEVKNYYKDKFNEILIDEYQDTSDIQETFISLIANDNVYMVGDIKQSIYRFRNANPILFKDKYENYGEKSGGIRIDLNKNFRSREEVLSNINLIFDKLMNAYLGGANYKEEHRLSFGNVLYNEDGKTSQNNNFEILNYELDEDKNFSKEEIEIFTVAKDIKEKVESNYIIFDKDENIQRHAKYKDFAILLDRSTSFNMYKKIFEYFNIPLSVYKDESIKESANIKIIKNILILINKINKKEFDKKFKYAFLSIGRSYLFNLDDEYLFNTVMNNEIFNSEIFKMCQEVSRDKNIKNIHYILNKIISDFKFYEKIITIGDIEKNNVVIDYILKLSSSVSNIYTVDEFINYLDNITIGDLDIKYSLSKEDEDGVYLMTIHKSKGLEFPVVYFAGLDKAFNILELKDKFLFSKDYGFVLPYKDKNLKTLFSKTLLKNSYIKDEISEKLRLFYVALTRAKEKMIFVMNFKNDKDYVYVNEVVEDFERINYRSFADMIHSINKVVMPYLKNVDITSLNLRKDYQYAKKSDYCDKIKKVDEVISINEYISEESIMENKSYSKSSNTLFDNKTKNYIKEGLKVHLMMENLDFNNPDYTLIDSKYEVFVKKFLELDILKSAKNVFKEYEFIYDSDNKTMHGIIDLLLEYDNQFIIIDYKLKNVNDEAYDKQLNGYKNYIEYITNKPCEIYLYSFIDGDPINLN